MKPAVLARVWGVAVTAVVWVGLAPATEEEMGTLGRRLEAAGRAEARFERVAPDPFGGVPIKTAGRLALEPPDRAELRFASTRERLTLRDDGGEWLQPELEQMIRFQRSHASAALRWWQAVLGTGSNGLKRRRLGDREWMLVSPASEGVPADSVRVHLSKSGLPERLEVNEGMNEPAVYNFSDWRFVPARGRSSFVVAAPEGYEVVAMP